MDLAVPVDVASRRSVAHAFSNWVNFPSEVKLESETFGGLGSNKDYDEVFGSNGVRTHVQNGVYITGTHSSSCNSVH